MDVTTNYRLTAMRDELVSQLQVLNFRVDGAKPTKGDKQLISYLVYNSFNSITQEMGTIILNGDSVSDVMVDQLLSVVGIMTYL